MNLLKREAAPITPEAWSEIDEEARRVLSVKLAGRRLVDVEGPHGWDFAAVNTGTLHLFDEQPQEGVSAGIRRVQPVVELRTPFELDLMELDSISRGSDTPDLAPVAQAAERIALVEDDATFNGYGDAGIQGILEASPHEPAPFGTDPDAHLASVVAARQRLESDGVGGPYALALGTTPYSNLLRALDDGTPVIKMVRSIIGGPVVHTPSIDGGVLVSTRGGDFVLTIGQDYSIGFVAADRDKAELYLAVSFTFRAVGPEAAVPMP